MIRWALATAAAKLQVAWTWARAVWRRNKSRKGEAVGFGILDTAGDFSNDDCEGYNAAQEVAPIIIWTRKPSPMIGVVSEPSLTIWIFSEPAMIKIFGEVPKAAFSLDR